MTKLRRGFVRIVGLVLAVLGPVVVVAPPAMSARAHEGAHVRVVVDMIAAAPGHHLTSTATRGGDVLTYGVAHVAGVSTLGTEAVRVDATAALEYRNGSGPFDGSLTLTTADGVLAFAYRGQGTRNPDGSTSLSGSLKAISSNGVYAGHTGSGQVRGFRAAGVAVGGAIRYTIDLNLRSGSPGPLGNVEALRAPKHSDLVVNAQLAAAESFLLTGAPSRTWGNFQRVGTAMVGEVPVDVDLSASLRYDAGSGPLSGFITFTASDNSSIVVSYRGHTTANLDGSSDVRTRVTVVAGTGIWRGIRGSGVYVAHRPGGVGTVLDLTMYLRLR